MARRLLKARLIRHIVERNAAAVLGGRMTPAQSMHALRKQLIISSHFKDAKYVEVGDRIFLDPFAPFVPSPHFDKALENNSSRSFPLKPNYAQIAITTRCPCKCFHCHVQNTQGDELPKQAILDTLDDLVALDFPLVFFVGGEPMSRFDDLLDFVRAANGRMDTRIFTSGVGSSPERLRKLREAGLNGICVSIDHHIEAEHNRLRQYRDAFRQACETVSTARELGFYVSVVCCVTHRSVESGDYTNVVDLAERLGAHSIQLNEIRPVGRALEAKDPGLYLTPDDKRRLIEFYRRENQSPRPLAIVMPWYNEEPDKFGCTATSGQTAYVDPQGHVQPCQLVKVSIGNITKQRFGDIWRSFGPRFSHPVRDCIVHPFNDVVAGAEAVPVNIHRVLPLWQELCDAPTTDMFSSFGVPLRTAQAGDAPNEDPRGALSLRRGVDFELKPGHWLPKRLNLPYLALGRTIYGRSDDDAVPTHELLHVAQFADHGLHGVLLHYAKHFGKGLLQHRQPGRAFAEVPFEVEARAFAARVGATKAVST